MTLFASANGQRIASLALRVPWTGAWTADVVLADSGALSGLVTITIGASTMVGTVDPRFTGTFQLRSTARVVGGARGWQKTVPAKGYHNDAGVKLSQVLGDLAREVGETLAPLDASLERSLGPDYLRPSAPAATLLEGLLVSANGWRVDLDGTTRVGARAIVDAPAAGFDLVTFDPTRRWAELGVEDVSTIGVGTRLSARLDSPLVVRELELHADQGKIRAFALGVATPSGKNRPLQALNAIARAAVPELPLLPPRRYRVVEMVADRASLQVVRKTSGVPDALLIPISPGTAGLAAVLTPGSEVLVQFVDADPAQPLVTHHSPKGGPGWIPVSLTLDATSTVTVGASASSIHLGAASGRVIREGDFIELAGVVVGANPHLQVVIANAGLDPVPSKVIA